MVNFSHEKTALTNDSRGQQPDTLPVQIKMIDPDLKREIELDMLAYRDHLTGSDHTAPTQGHFPAFRL